MDDRLPKMRKDPITGEWVIFAPEKTHTVITNTKGSKTPLSLSSFSSGFEYTTGETLFTTSGNYITKEKWSVRAFPAKHPLLRVEESCQVIGDGLYDVMSRIGAHEVIVETSRDINHLDELTAEELVDVFVAYQNRMNDLKRDARVKSLMILKNFGGEAGAVMPGHYSELIAFPFIPPTLAQEIGHAEKYYNFKNRCVFCDLIRQEESFEKRVVAENGDFIAIAPYASRFPFEITILPTKHISHFREQSNETLLSLAILYKTVLHAMRSLLDNPAWNLILHTAPINGRNQDFLSYSYHWHMSIFPRVSSITSMTFGAGVFVNPILPEEAAEALRKVIREV